MGWVITMMDEAIMTKDFLIAKLTKKNTKNPDKTKMTLRDAISNLISQCQ